MGGRARARLTPAPRPPHPAIRRLRRWADRGLRRLREELAARPGLRRLVPFVGLAAGLASFVLIERGEGAAAVVPLTLVAGWAGLLAAGTLAREIEHRLGIAARPEVGAWFLQSLHQEAFFFALPFLWAATTWTSRHALFTVPVTLIAAATLSDPFYLRQVARRPRLRMALHLVAFFVAFGVALPILGGLDAVWGLVGAGSLAGAMAMTAAHRPGELRTRQAVVRVVAAAVLAGGAAWSLRTVIPPAPLRLVDQALTDEVRGERRSPANRLQEVDARRLHERGLVAWTAIRAPRGLHEDVWHVWLHEGRVIDRIPLAIQGGRLEGYRTWSRKAGFPADPAGRWAVEVRTAYDQMLGRLEFDVR